MELREPPGNVHTVGIHTVDAQGMSLLSPLSNDHWVLRASQKLTKYVTYALTQAKKYLCAEPWIYVSTVHINPTFAGTRYL